MKRSIVFNAVAIAAVSLTVGSVAVAQDAFYGNILFTDPATGIDETDAADDCNSPAYAALANNDVGTDPLLIDPYNRTAPNWAPGAGSIADGAVDNVSNIAYPADEAGCGGADDNCEALCDGFVFPTCYRGAIPPAGVGADWTQGWTYYNFDGTGRTDIDYGKPLVVITGATGTQTLVNDNNYLLRGRVQVGDGIGTPHILTIEAGTVLLGENSTDGYLVVERGAQIIANGTAANPIIMTTDLAPGSMVRGGWGGLVIHGRAVANCANCLGGQSCESEGGTAGFFCGGNDCDGSGSLKYVRVEYAGIDIATDNELNAFTFNGVGCNMNAQYLQAHMGFDDNFEWFGGSMSARYLVSTGGGDDGIDWQMGWRGGVQFAIDQHYDDDGDKGIEADNNEFTLNAACRSNPVLANLTLVGPNDPFGNPTDGINLRRGTDAQIFNSIVQGWPEFALQVQNVESCARGFNPDPGVFCGPAVDVEATTPNIANVALRAFPNPVTQRANFAFSLDRAGEVDLSIFDVSGRMIANVVNSSLPAGSHDVAWDVPGSVTSGVYMYRFASGGQRQTGRFFRVK